MLYHCNCPGYTGRLYIGFSVTSDFSDTPQQLIFLGYTVFGIILAISQRFSVLERTVVTRQSDVKTEYVS
jgi:hypothetical protein